MSCAGSTEFRTVPMLLARRSKPASLFARSALALALAAGLAQPAVAQAPASPASISPPAAMLRFPGVSKTHIAFSYANNLWLVPRSGGQAQPVAAPPGPATFPRFSPDGSTIAFVGNYEGNRDLYTVPTAGGIPFRVTHHPGSEMLAGWTPDGKILFMTNGWAPLTRMTQLFTVPAAGGLPERLPLAYSGFGAISPDGKSVAFTPHSIDTRTWKRYRGGMATDLWIMDLASKEARQVTDWEGTDTLPMWGQGSDGHILYYLSDNGPEHRLNIWSFDTKSGKREQVTTFAEDDIRWPSIGPGDSGRGEIVFQLGSKLMLLDLASRQSREVKVTIPGARPAIRPQIEEVGDRIVNATISPSGKRVAAEARGEIWSLPAKEGVARNLTQSAPVFDRSPAWSPDGRWIAYFSDESGEYELWVRPSDAREPQKDDKPEADAKDQPKADADAKAEGDKKPEAEKKPAKLEPTKLTTLGPGFRSNIAWSPDSKHVTFQDNSGAVHLATFKTGDDGTLSVDHKVIDTDPWGENPAVSWSHDSAWIAYTRSDELANQNAIWLYNLKSGERKQATSSMFNVGDVAFDRAGDFLYFRANRHWTSPIYADLDTTFIYAGTDVLHMVPLREDVKHPFAARSDEEELKPAKKDAKKDEAKKDEPKKDSAAPAAKADDGVSGTWEGTASGVPNTPGPIPFTLRVRVTDGKASGTINTVMGGAPVSGTYDKASNTLTLNGSLAGAAFTFTFNLKGEDAAGSWNAGDAAGTASAKRTGQDAGDTPGDKPEAKDNKDSKDAKELKIDIEGFERRAIPLPVPPGNFGNLAVADGNKLLYVRQPARGGGGDTPARVMIFDPKDDAREEKQVTNAGGFALSADGKKILVQRGGSIAVVDASAGGKSQTVSTSGLRMTVDPRAEWRQIFTDAGRLVRDFFYEPTLHGVDWDGIRKHYGAMIEDAANREDVNWIISEMISELNIGHAYLGAPGDIENQPNISVGLLGVDFELHTADAGTAYRIKRIYEGGPWDSDARGPLSQPHPTKNRINAGDYLLAVNGVPVDTRKDPYAAFIGLADRTVSLTVSTKPVKDGTEREVLVPTLSSEVNLRYRAWIESRRAEVDRLSNGQIGYIYVPNTGVDGQSDLFRQFFGQRGKAALIIDDRWNGGGQIPTRFIELLNRPVTNFWARRHGKDWVWPPDSHQGPKAMLMNGLAGSGGDMFPWLFRHNNLGKLIGTRTWGGLVGISGNPAFIDGGNITVPTFGFYETDGTWGVEGHGVDPDILVVDHPTALAKGEDPQLEAAVKHLLDEIKTKGFQRPARPASPNRRGMGIPPADR
jgi:tricorn protease